MDKGFWIALAASLLAGMATTGGILTIRRFETWARRNTTYFACFAAGVLIAVSLLHLVPKSISLSEQAPIYLFAGYVLMHLFHRLLTGVVCDKGEAADYALGLVPLAGIGFHSFIDGVIYSVSFSVGTLTGGLVALGMVLHEFPEGIITYALLTRSGFSQRRSFLLAFLAAAATTPLGTLVSFPFIARIDDQVLGALLAVSSGALLYVGATHLLPRAETEPRRLGILAFAAGSVLAFAIVQAQA